MEYLLGFLSLLLVAYHVPAQFLSATGLHQEIFYSAGVGGRPFGHDFGLRTPQFLLEDLFHRPAYIPANLFTPNTEQQPAETAGQIENYRKALEEEAKQAEKELNDIYNDTVQLSQQPKSFVQVRHFNFRYSY